MSEKNKNENTEQTETEVQTSGNDTEMLQESEKTEDNSKKETKKTESKSKKPLTRKSKKRIASIVISLCVVAAVVLVNIIADVLTDKYSAMTTDITSTKSFDMTEDSRKIVSSLKKNAKITFLTNKASYESMDTYYKQTSLLASQFAQNSDGKITVEYIDLVQNPTYADRYADEDLSTNDIIISSGDKYKVLTQDDLFNFEQYSETYRYIISSKSEQAFDNALVTVTSDVSTKVALVTDNCGSDYSYFKSTMMSNNYEVQEISLEKDDLTTDFETVIVYAPTKDFTSDAVDKLHNYLLNNNKYGKNVIYVPYERHADTPNLDALLEAYGMMIEDGLAFDLDTSRLMGSGYYDGIACTYSSKLYLDNIDGNSYPVIVGLARPVVVLNDNVASPLLTLSKDSSGYCPFDAEDGKWSMTDAVTGNVCVAAQGVMGNDNGRSTLVIFGSNYMLTRSYLGSAFNNSVYVFNVLATLNDRDTSVITVAEKVISDHDITLSRNAAFGTGFVIFAVIPLVILGAGFVVYLMRRHK